ncbi:MAG: hypothetical protein DI539_17420 [Flavobacterium psychrophilum]|nr:MAG: hypothetical protein DI539_17420 [Flavobacterium psychrophilum]
MRNPFIYLFALVMTTLSLTSCSSDDDKGSVSKSREIKYEITGSYSGGGVMSIVYIQNNQPIITEATSLPWTKTYTANDDIAVGGFNCDVSGATPGEVVTLKVYQGGTVIETVDATATSDGLIIGSISTSFE